MKLRRLLYWKLARLGTLQDLVHVARRPPEQVMIIRRIGDQSADLDVFAEGIDGGQFAATQSARPFPALQFSIADPSRRRANGARFEGELRRCPVRGASM